MKQKVAILTQKGVLSKGLQENTTINIFELENDKIVGVENVLLEETSEVKFSFMMCLKQVSIIYTESITNSLKKVLQTIGISIKCKDELNDDQFIALFEFK